MRYYYQKKKNNSYNTEGLLVLLLSILICSFFYQPLESFVFSFRYIYILVFIFIFGYIIYSLFKQHQLNKTGIREIDKMTGEEFEIYLSNLFSRLGYNVKHLGKSGDLGSDLIIDKNGIKTAVQAKRYRGYVGPDAVREIFTSINPRKCTSGMVVTNSFYTSEAKYLARTNNVILWDRYELIKNILKIKK